jgi:hypothetical protein
MFRFRDPQLRLVGGPGHDPVHCRGPVPQRHWNSNGIIENTGTGEAAYGDGVSVVGPCKDVSILNVTARNVKRYGIYVESPNPGIRTQIVDLKNNKLLDSTTANTIGIYVKNVWRVSQDGNTVFNFDLTGSHHEDVVWSDIGASDHAGDSQSASFCYNFVDVTNIKFDGSASCLEYAAHATTTAYTVGQRVYADTDKVYECTVAGTSGGSSPPTGTGTAIVDGSVTWCYVHRRRKNAGGLNFSGVSACSVSDAARFENLVGAWATGSVPATLRRSDYYSHIDSLVAGEATFNFTWPEPDNNFIVTIDGGVNETFYASDADKSMTSFKVKSSNAGSTAAVRVSVSR